MLTEEERRAELRKEPNKTLWLSSAFFQDHWLYDKCTDLCKSMLAGGKSFVCGLPYQIAMEEGLISEEQIREQMSGSDFTEIKWSINISVLRKPIEPCCLQGVLHNVVLTGEL